MYTVVYHRRVIKDLKRVDKKVAYTILNKIIPLLIKEPSAVGIRLTGVLSAFYKYLFSIQGVLYRIIYKLIHKENTVWIPFIGSRENIYSRLLRQL